MSEPEDLEAKRRKRREYNWDYMRRYNAVYQRSDGHVPGLPSGFGKVRVLLEGMADPYSCTVEEYEEHLRRRAFPKGTIIWIDGKQKVL